jgi:hypothetical protein
MSVWHHKGELLAVGSGFATYRFFPDHVMAPAVSGVFRLSLSTFDVEVVEPANAESKGLVSNDEHCVAALVHKIRRALKDTGEVPNVAYFIA